MLLFTVILILDKHNKFSNVNACFCLLLANTEEYMMLEKSQKLSKRILEFVNQAVQDCENHHRLRELQRRLDKRQFENLPDIDEEFRVTYCFISPSLLNVIQI